MTRNPGKSSHQKSIVSIGLIGILLVVCVWGVLGGTFRSANADNASQASTSGITLTAPVSPNIAVDYTSPIRKLDPIASGMDVSAYGYPNVFANDQVEQQKLKTLGIKYMRMALKYSTTGDPTSKIVCDANGCDTRWTGDQWINAIKGIGAEPVVKVYTKSSVDAANMVKHFNKDTNNYIKYWIVGNEPNINGYSVQSYSSYFNQDYDAMKAVDPTIKIGGGTTAWYDQYWLQQFLQLSGTRVDFVDFHGYAQQGTVAGNYTTLFEKARYSTSINQLRSLIQKIVPARASQIGIEVGEWELNWGGSAQDYTNFHAVWAASALGHILSSGGWSLFYADKGNAIFMHPHTITDPYGHVVNINPDDTNPAYHGIGMFTGEGLFQGFGDTVVNASTTLPNVEVYASDNPKNIVVINEDPSITQTATISLNGVTSGTIDVWRKDESVLFPNPPVKLGTLPLQNGTFTYQLTPFSVTTFVLNTDPSQTSPALSPSPSVTLSPTLSPSPSVTPSPTPGATPQTALAGDPAGRLSPTPSPAPGVTLAQDTFQRANQTEWGTASDGQIWGGDSNSSHVFSIAGNSGQLANGYNSYSAVLGPTATNAQVLFSGSMSSFKYTNLGAVLRWTNGNNWYKAYIDGADLVIQKKVNGSTTILNETAFPAQAGISYTLRFSVVGSTLSAKVWQTGSSEPGNWMVTATDSTFQSGYCGLRILVQNGTMAQITTFTALAQ